MSAAASAASKGPWYGMFKALDAEEALETLAFASLLMRRLDDIRP